MKTQTKQKPLAGGQLWQVNDRYLEVVEMGKRITHYRLLNSLNQRGVPTRVGRAEDVAAYLSNHKAKLLARANKVVRPVAA